MITKYLHGKKAAKVPVPNRSYYFLIFQVKNPAFLKKIVKVLSKQRKECKTAARKAAVSVSNSASSYRWQIHFR